MKQKFNLTLRGVQILLCAALSFSFYACEKDVKTDGYSKFDEPELLPLSQAQKDVIATLPANVIIAHRGSEFWAPEESEVAMRWARNMGADYIEIDLQRTKDGVLMALHDDNLVRTTNVDLVYPNRKNDYVSAFTFAELLKLDIGSWFNFANPKQARETFVGEQVLTLEDVIMVAEGYRYLRKGDLPLKYPALSDVEKRQRADTAQVTLADLTADGITDYRISVDPVAKTIYVPDEHDNGNRPGVYVETKAPYLFAGIEKNLAAMLTQLGWYNDDPAQMKEVTRPNPIPAGEVRVNIANTDARIILQTFDKGSLRLLNKAFNRLRPTLFLYGDIPSTPVTYADKINFAIENGATIMGPNIDYVSGYPASIMPWQGDMIRRTGMHIHAWSFNTQEQYIKYTGPWSDPNKEGAVKNYLDGAFTNLTDLALNYYNNYLQTRPINYFRSNAHLNLPDNLHKDKPHYTAQEVLETLGY
jgi:glycerophosphoryl diester phosphodiesterase